MLRRNPALIVRLSTTRDRGTISTHNSHLIRGIDLLRATRRPFGAFPTFPGSDFLWKKRGNPGIVDEVESADEDGEEEKVEEDAGVVVRPVKS